jgi:uncharacterized protein (TIGR02588 family)
MWEWIVAAIGVLIVAGVLGFLLYEALGGNRLPPDVRLSIDSVARSGSGYLVTMTATNEGGLTAEGVIIEGQLEDRGRALERSQTTIEYLPSRSRKKAGLFFTRDPARFELVVRALGYEEP